MHKIKELCRLIHEELEGAEHYIDLAMSYKEADRGMADTFADLSAQEATHAEKLGSLVSTQVSRIKQQDDGVTPANAQWIWTWEHEKMMDCLAKIRMKQEMYRK